MIPMTMPSLVVPEEQEELFNEQHLPLGRELLDPVEHQQGRFTAERVARNQERYRMIVQALGQGLPVRMICSAFSVSHHVVKLIREREPELIATEKQRMSRLLWNTARLSVEGFVEDLERGVVPPNVKAIGAGIFLDKKALLDGEATSRIEVVRTDLPSLEDMRRVIEALPSSEVLSEGKGLETP